MSKQTYLHLHLPLYKHALSTRLSARIGQRSYKMLLFSVQSVHNPVLKALRFGAVTRGAGKAFHCSRVLGKKLYINNNIVEVRNG